MNRTLLTGLLLALLLAATGCASEGVVTQPELSEPPPAAVSTETPAEEEPAVTEEPESSIAWIDTPLTDAVTGKEFKLSDYKGKPVLLHAFAVW